MTCSGIVGHRSEPPVACPGFPALVNAQEAILIPLTLP